MAELKLVRTLDQIKDDVIRDLKTNWKSIQDLERKHGLNKSIIIDLQKRYDPQKKCKNIVKISRTPRAKEEPVQAKPSNFLVNCNSIAIALVAVAIGGVGIALNFQFYRSLGQTEFSSYTFGVLGIAIDVVTLCLPSLWQRQRWGQFLVSVVIFMLCLGLSLVAGMSFAATNIGDSLQARESVTRHRQALNAEFASDQAEMARIADAGDPRVIEEKIQIARGKIPAKNRTSSEDCTNVTASGVVCEELNQLRASKRTAERRIELEATLRRLNEEIAALPPIGAKDPGADYISHLSWGFVAPQTIEGFRIFGLACMPSLAGLILMFARRRG